MEDGGVEGGGGVDVTLFLLLASLLVAVVFLVRFTVVYWKRARRRHQVDVPAPQVHVPRAQPFRPGDPRELGGCRLLGLLGEGGQGAVFEGVSPAGQPVAVKLLHARLAGDPQARNRLLGEAAVTRQVARFCIAEVYHTGLDGDRPYVVSELIVGRSLFEQVSQDGPMGPAALHRLAVGTAAALVAIHAAGVMHRDFKPSNVLIGLDGPRVIDFGIARMLDETLSRASGIIGTPSYMSPEQFGDDPVGQRSDMFSWATTMVFAATGRPAFGADSIPAVIRRILADEADLSAVPPELRPIVTRCLAKDPQRRPEATEVLTRLAATTVAGAAPTVSAPIEGQRELLARAAAYVAETPAAEPPEGRAA